MNGETHNPKISTLLHICEAFDITLMEFFDDNVFNDVRDEQVEGKMTLSNAIRKRITELAKEKGISIPLYLPL